MIHEVLQKYFQMSIRMIQVTGHTIQRFQNLTKKKTVTIAPKSGLHQNQTCRREKNSSPSTPVKKFEMFSARKLL